MIDDDKQAIDNAKARYLKFRAQVRIDVLTDTVSWHYMGILPNNIDVDFEQKTLKSGSTIEDATSAMIAAINAKTPDNG